MSMFNTIVITNRHLCCRTLIEQIKRITSIETPDKLILREKDLCEEDYERLAEEVVPICKENNIDCILHTYSKVAKKMNIRKIHLSLYQWKESMADLQFFEEIGVSVHSVKEAKEAEAKGATYLIAGHIFSTDCKKGIPPRGIPFLQQVCKEVSVPVYAIGGIKKEHYGTLKQTGAAGACIMSELMRF